LKGQGHWEQKTKVPAFCFGVVLWGTVLVWHFLRCSPLGAVLYGGGKISACCLVDL